MREAREEVWDEAEVVHSERMVVLCAMQELRGNQTLATWQSNNEEAFIFSKLVRYAILEEGSYGR